MPIFDLQLKNLGPFDDIRFEFDPHVNVLVGPNNSGKSTALMALGDITVHDFSIPRKLFRKGGARFGVRRDRRTVLPNPFAGSFPLDSNQAIRAVGGHWYQQFHYSRLIPAIRWSTDFRAESPVAGNTEYPYSDSERKERGIGKASGAKSHDFAGRETPVKTGASLVRDAALIQKMINLDYRAYRQRNPAIRKIVEKVSTLASEITDGFPIEFMGIAEDDAGLYPKFKTPDGILPINVLSQGTQSIIQWLGLLLIGYAEYYDFPENLEEKPGIVIIDEIDAHLHPSWQRRIVPTLSRHFPSLQIFCSSHSPFVLAGLKAGQAHLLKRDEKGKVVVSRNETDIVGWSTDEILRNFLDIVNPTDLQTSNNITRLQELRGKRKLTPNQKKELEQLRAAVNRDLLAGPVASAVEQFAELIRKPPSASRPPKKASTPKKGRRVSASPKSRVGAKGRRT